MKLIPFLLLLTLPYCALTNQKDTVSDEDWLVFGIKYGECVGRCAYLYKITSSGIYDAYNLNTIADPLNQPYYFNQAPLEKEKFDYAQILVLEFPDSLWQDTRQVFGTPDSHDQGGIILEKRTGSSLKRWYIDTDTDKLPNYLRKYAKQIQDIQQKIN